MSVDKSMIPSFDNMFRPTMQALQELGGKASIEDLNKKVLHLIELPAEAETIPHTDVGSDRRTEVEYRLAWARTYLKQFAYSVIQGAGYGNLQTHTMEIFRESFRA